MPRPKRLEKNRDRESGQTLVEFLFLMIVLIGMSFAMLSGFNAGIANRWQALVTLIAQPTPSNIEL